jgi:hypothetical protein
MRSSAGRFNVEVYEDGSGIRLWQVTHGGNDESAAMSLADGELSDLIYVARKAMESANELRLRHGRSALEVR